MDDAGDVVRDVVEDDLSDVTVEVLAALDALHPQVLEGHLELISVFLNVTTNGRPGSTVCKATARYSSATPMH